MSQVQRIHRLIERHGHLADVIGVFWEGAWDGPTEVQVQDRTWTICWATSPLAVREALLPNAGPVVLLTNLAEDALGFDVRARLAKSHLERLNPWSAVKDRFRLKLDAQLFQVRWMAEALENVDPRFFAKSNGMVISAELAWRGVLQHYLGWSENEPWGQSFLKWCTQFQAEAWLKTPEGLRRDLAGFLAERLGRWARHLDPLLAAGRVAEILPLGLLNELLLLAPNHPSRVRCEERYLGGNRLTTEEMQDWYQETRQFWLKLTKVQQMNGLQAAQTIAMDLGLSSVIHLSRLMPESLRLAERDLAQRLDAFLAEPTLAGLNPIEAIVHQLQGHQLKDDKREADWQSIQRLARFLVQPEPNSNSVDAYLSEQAWVDLIRDALLVGQRQKDLQPAIDRLLHQVALKRERFNAGFAKLVEALSMRQSVGAYGIAIEDFSTQVILPLLKEHPVVWVVMDGMSVPAFYQLATQLEERGWNRWEKPESKPVIAALPSVTEISRASLLCGRLVQGQSDQEQKGFSAWAERHAVTAKLFHKVDLVQEEQAVLERIESATERLVALVINAIDDQLAKGGQFELGWDLDRLPILEKVLQSAQVSGRAVVLVSDHGHVLERGTEMVASSGGGERYRKPDTKALAPSEVLVSGDRVVGHSWVLPWSESLRYVSGKKVGYHGGASPQELIVPWGVFGAGYHLNEPWQIRTLARPAWWSQTPEHGQKLEVIQVAKSDWIDALFLSPVYSLQLQRYQDRKLREDQLRALLELLQVENPCELGRVGQAMRMNERNVRGFIFKVQRLLNFDGYPVVELKDQLVHFNRQRLLIQFEMDDRFT
ncbi:MAG: BREX-2 system phosphatase PglZ [Acidobacteria bacterium]|nr:BREX-2 system phosphatase PglZ [Acidobacteriota bacterium]MCB9398402.1 BREX-2 system phosphatase PglZ [Acidobacteriota bacterium]